MLGSAGSALTRRHALAVTAAVVAAVAFLPFARGLLAGHAFYFRDLSLHFFPLRRFALDGLRAGEMRYWNPYLHEGIPSPFPPVSYPLELLQLLRPDEWGISLFLALHVPFAAVAFLALTRHLGLPGVPAAGGAFVYALGGFCLSSLNLYVYLEAIAWAPLVILSVRRAAEGRPRDVALGGVVTAVAWSTVGVELVAQALLVAVVLAWPSTDHARRLGRIAGALALSLGLSAPTTAVMSGVVAASARGPGFAPAVVLGHSVHPLTLMQVVIGDFYGELWNVPNRWWGENFFPRGFPYFLSLYLGATALALAAVGVRHGRALRARLAVLAVLALVVCLGRWGVIGPLVEALPPIRRFRFPSKAFFTVHLAVALLAALGLDALERGLRPAWRRLAGLALVLGALLAAAPLIPRLLPEPARWFAWGFFPSDYSWPLREERLAHVLHDAAVGGAVALGAAGLALLVVRGRLGPRLAAGGVVGLLAADLLRTGAGLNPMVATGFYRLSPEMTAQLPLLRDGGRVFVCEPSRSRAYWDARDLRPESHEVWTFETYRETLTPNFNLLAGIPSALSEDLTSLVPASATPGETAGCDHFAPLAERLRRAAVTHVVSLDPLSEPGLSPQATPVPPDIAPLRIHLYRLSDSLPRFSVSAATPPGEAGRAELVHEGATNLELAVHSEVPAVLVIRDGAAPGWRAWVNGSPADVTAAEGGRHRAVRVAAGASRVQLRYRPSRLPSALVATAVSLALTAALGWRGSQPGRSGAASPGG